MFGAAMGLACGFLGVAGLPFVVSWLALSTDLTHQQCVGTSFMACLPAVAAASLAHTISGNVPLALYAPLAAGAMLGTYAGAWAHLATPTPILQLAFGSTLFLAGARGVWTLRRLKAFPFC